MLNYVNVLDNELINILGNLNDFEGLKRAIEEKFEVPIKQAIEHDYKRDGDIVDMKLFELKNNTTIDICTTINKGLVDIYINYPTWSHTLAAEWDGIRLKFRKSIKL